MNVFEYAEKDGKTHTTGIWKGITRIEVCEDGIILKRGEMIISIKKPVDYKTMYVIEEDGKK